MYAKFVNTETIEPVTFPVQYSIAHVKDGIQYSTGHTILSEGSLTSEAISYLTEQGYKPVQNTEAPTDRIVRPAYINESNQIVCVWETVNPTDMNAYERRKYADILRRRRENECFKIVDRNQIWKDSLTAAQRSDLVTWYLAWLDAPETLVVPTRPDWLT